MDLALGFSTAEDIRHHELEEIDWFEDEYVVISHTCRTALTRIISPRAIWWSRRGTKSRGVGFTSAGIRLYPADSAQNPSMLSAPFIVAQSDLLMAIPRYAAEKFLHAAPIAIFPLPFAISPFTVKIYSHKRGGQRGATKWLKTALQSRCWQRTPGVLTSKTELKITIAIVTVATKPL